MYSLNRIEVLYSEKPLKKKANNNQQSHGGLN